ncbi:MAG: hypothetical protein K5679_09775 [Lachnospiraceae bacterium]|nr:hypothetical protein [Lachnospiraceae bacterium]
MRRIERMRKNLTKTVAIALSFSIMFGQTIGSYAEELNTATSLYEEGLELVEAAEAEIEDAVFEGIDAADLSDTASELENYSDAAEGLESAAGSAIENADTANTSDSRDEAYEAKDNAEASLSEAEGKLNDSLTALENAQSAYTEASAAQDAAETAYETAQSALTDTQNDTIAAREALEAAKNAFEVQEVKKNALEEIEAQYYGTNVQYFRRVLGNRIVFNEDGTVNIKESALKVTTNDNNKYADKGDGAYFAYATLLTEQLLEYMITQRENVDPETADFKFGEQNSEARTKKTAQVAVVFKNTAGQDQVADRIHTDVSGNPVYPGETKEVYAGTLSYDSGRHNHFPVTYKDISGNEHTEYYNFVLKSEKYGDVADVEKGNIYLARIEKDENGNWVNTRVEDDNNYDDYEKLTAAIEALNQIEDYNRAKADADAALARVEALEATLASLTESATATKANLDFVRGALSAAKEELEAAKANKESLQTTYEEAKAAVEAIDLSRFNIVIVPVVYEEPATKPEVVEIAPIDTPASATPAVYEEPIINPEVIEEIITATAAVPAVVFSEPSKEVTEVIAEEITEAPIDTPYELTEADIDADLTPLANLPLLAENLKNTWWIWIVIIATIITMYILYKKTKKEEETH